MLPIRKNAESGGRILKDHMPPPGYVDDFRNVVKRDNGDDIFYPLNHS